MTDLKLGLKPFKPDNRDALFASFTKKTELPKLPEKFGYAGLLANDIGMFGNDTIGDCAAAEAAHASMLLSQLGGHPEALFTDKEVIEFYSAVTGYDPADPSTDQGTDYRDMMKYLRAHGITDARGVPHKIGAFVLLEQGNVDELDMALYLFGNVPVGVDLPDSAMDQFNRGEAWDVVKGAHVEGGHAIGGVQKVDATHYLFTTWGRKQPVTRRFLAKYLNQAWGTLAPEMLRAGRSPQGFDTEQLTEYLHSI
jgi:hypothetical protein